MITIEKGIPIPERNYQKARYPFKGMEIGDSFFVPEEDYKGLGYATFYFMKYIDKSKKFINRKVEGGGRCWRIE